MASAHEEAFNAVMKEIKASAERLGQASITEGARAAALRELAAAYRHLRGGQQPGGAQVVEK